MYNDVLIEDPGAALRAMESLAVSTLKGLAKQLVQQQLLLAAELLTSLVYKPKPCTPKLTRAEWRERRNEGREEMKRRGMRDTPADSIALRYRPLESWHMYVMDSLSRYGALP